MDIYNTPQVFDTKEGALAFCSKANKRHLEGMQFTCRPMGDRWSVLFEGNERKGTLTISEYRELLALMTKQAGRGDTKAARAKAIPKQEWAGDW